MAKKYKEFEDFAKICLRMQSEFNEILQCEQKLNNAKIGEFSEIWHTFYIMHMECEDMLKYLKKFKKRGETQMFAKMRKQMQN